jgi:hypothetical protein
MAFVIEDETDDDYSGDYGSPVHVAPARGATANVSRSQPTTTLWGRSAGYGAASASADPYNFDIGDADNMNFEEASPPGKKQASKHAAASSRAPSSSSSYRGGSSVAAPSASFRPSIDISAKADQYVNKYKGGVPSYMR